MDATSNDDADFTARLFISSPFKTLRDRRDVGAVGFKEGKEVGGKWGFHLRIRISAVGNDLLLWMTSSLMADGHQQQSGKG